MRYIICIMGLVFFVPVGVCAVTLNVEDVEQPYLDTQLRGVALHTGWVYQEGDDLQWALPTWPDADWRTVQTPQETGLLSVRNWAGIGWFRYTFEMGSGLQNVPLVLLLDQFGASEIYLDGKQIGRFGTVGKNQQEEQIFLIDNAASFMVLPPLNAGKHVLAVRFSNFESVTNIIYRMPVGFRLLLSKRTDGMAWRADINRLITLHQMLLVIPLSMSLLHFLLFLFNRYNREDLYYALLTLSLAGMIYAPMQLSYVRDVETYVLVFALFKLSLALSGVFGLWFIQHFFRGGITPYFKVVVALGGVLCVLAFLLNIEIYFVFLLLTYPVAVQTIFRAFCLKRRGAGLVGVGLLIFIACCVAQIIIELKAIDCPTTFFPYIYGSIVLVLAMSFHLARIFARTHQNLEEQLQQVKELSSLALAQEKESKRLELLAQEEDEKRRLLEADNAQKEKAVEEARKRQSMLGELQETNNALQATQEKLIQSEKMASLGNLVAGIAHEINTPVGAINSMHDTLMRAMNRLQPVLESEFGEALQKDRAMRAPLQVIQDANRVIANGAERVTEIVRSLRSFARLDDAERKEVDLHEGIENTLTLVQHDLKNRIDVVKEYGTLPLVSCFPSRLNQVFLNLLVNASQAIEGTGKITIRTRVVDKNIEIDIVDTGRGISKENLSRIFDPGFTTKGVGVGTGLGLSICYQIMEDHNGEIRVTSREGEGTTFTIVLPLTT